jgi:formate/nitrite transporter FocA (FNT family)
MDNIRDNPLYTLAFAIVFYALFAFSSDKSGWDLLYLGAAIAFTLGFVASLLYRRRARKTKT